MFEIILNLIAGFILISVGWIFGNTIGYYRGKKDRPITKIKSWDITDKALVTFLNRKDIRYRITNQYVWNKGENFMFTLEVKIGGTTIDKEFRGSNIEEIITEAEKWYTINLKTLSKVRDIIK